MERNAQEKAIGYFDTEAEAAAAYAQAAAALHGDYMRVA